MVADEAQLEPACDPEQAGIILDRLATELHLAQLNNPRAVPGLQDDARELLAYLEGWLARGANELAVTARNITPSGDVDVLARSLRYLAEELFELADREMDSEETSGSDFDPLSVADALQVLETEVGPELGGEDAERALVALRAELRNVVACARAWAERQGLPTKAIPNVPPSSASKRDCMAALRHLAGVATGHNLIHLQRFHR